MAVTIIVEGKHDRSRLRRLLSDNVRIVCTYGTPGTARLAALQREIGNDDVYIFTDNDPSGRKIRYLLNETFVDATHIYTRRSYAGVEGTPDEYMIQQLEKHDLHLYLKPQTTAD